MASPVSVRHLRAFLAVAEAGSTAAAARNLNLSQPSISIAIRELEEILGQALFQRVPARGLLPTRFGQRKLPEARALIAGLASFENEAGAVAGQVAFGYFATLGPQYVPAILNRMARLYPEINVTPVEADLDELNRLMEGGRVEIALSYDVEVPASIVSERVAELEPYALLPADHPLAGQDHVTVAELAAIPQVLVDLPLSREFLLSVFRSEGLEPRIAYRTRSLEMVVGLVANGLGASVLVTRRAMDTAYDGRRVMRRPIIDSRLRQGLIIARPVNAALTGPAEALAACIRAELSGNAASVL